LSRGSADFIPPAVTGRGEVHRKIQTYAVGTPNVGQRCNFRKIFRGYELDIGVNVIDDSAVDSNRSIGAGVVDIAGTDFARQFRPLPQRISGVAAFDAPVGIVPVIEHPQLDFRPFEYIEPIDRLPSLQQAEKMKRAVERAAFPCGDDTDRVSIAYARRADNESFLADLRHVRSRRDSADQRRIGNGPDHHRSIPDTCRTGLKNWNCSAQHGGQSCLPFPCE
jgi:hypothetical protein